MTDRGLPIVDGAPACPFVAFEDDRDARATSPDHRHRCYAEIRPAPRALAHQEAYCLSSAFPVCPTFQDWARREAASARTRGEAEPPAGPPDVQPTGERREMSWAPGTDHDRGAGGEGAGAAAGALGPSERNPPRDWAAPPPWAARDDPDLDDEPEVAPLPPPRGGGLAGSFADRLAGGTPPGSAPPVPPPGPAPGRWDEDDEGGDEDDEAWSRRAAARRSAGGRDRRATLDDRRRDDARADAPALAGPSWERPRRLEAYPTLKTRIGLPSLALPSILVGLLAVLLAAVALFFLPTLLGIGNPPAADSSPTPTAQGTAGPSASPGEPTPTPGPTQLVYVVQPGDTMSSIAGRFNVPLQVLIDANRETVPNPDVLEIGQEVIIPGAAPTTLPGVTPTPVP